MRKTIIREAGSNHILATYDGEMNLYQALKRYAQENYADEEYALIPGTAHQYSYGPVLRAGRMKITATYSPKNSNE